VPVIVAKREGLLDETRFREGAGEARGELALA